MFARMLPGKNSHVCHASAPPQPDDSGDLIKHHNAAWSMAHDAQTSAHLGEVMCAQHVPMHNGLMSLKKKNDGPSPLYTVVT